MSDAVYVAVLIAALIVAAVIGCGVIVSNWDEAEHD